MRGGTREAMLKDVYAAWRDDVETDKDSVMVAGSNTGAVDAGPPRPRRSGPGRTRRGSSSPTAATPAAGAGAAGPAREFRSGSDRGGHLRSAVEGCLRAGCAVTGVPSDDVDVLAPAPGHERAAEPDLRAINVVVMETGVLRGKNRRALDSTVLEDAVATQDTVTQLIAAIRRVAGGDRRQGACR